MLNNEQLQILTLKASYVHEHADRPYFKNELNRVGETLHEAAYLNYFVRYRSNNSSSSSTHNSNVECENNNNLNNNVENSNNKVEHRWSRINKIIYLSEWNANDVNNRESNYSNSNTRASEPLSYFSESKLQVNVKDRSEPYTQDGRPRLIIDTSFTSIHSPKDPLYDSHTTESATQSALPPYIIWRQKTFWVALIVEGEAQPVLPHRLSNKLPTEDEVAAFCAYQMHHHVNQTYRDGYLEEDKSKVELQQTAMGADDNDDDTTSNSNNETNVENAWSTLDPRDYLPTYTQINKLKEFRQRRITQHQWTDAEIKEAKELNARFNQAGVAATPVGSTLNKLHNMKLESELSLAQRVRLGDIHAISAAALNSTRTHFNANKYNDSTINTQGNTKVYSQTSAFLTGSPGTAVIASPGSSTASHSSSLLMSNSSRRVPRFDEVNPLTQLPLRKRKRNETTTDSSQNAASHVINNSDNNISNVNSFVYDNDGEYNSNSIIHNNNNSNNDNRENATIRPTVVTLPLSSPHSPFLPRKLKERAVRQFAEQSSNTSFSEENNNKNTSVTRPATTLEEEEELEEKDYVGSFAESEDRDDNNIDYNYAGSRNRNNNTNRLDNSSLTSTPAPSQVTPSLQAETLVNEETIEQWRKMAEQEQAFYTYVSNPDRSAYLNKVSAISIRNAELNKRNRRIGIENERRLERKGNLLESGGLWVTDDAERARKAAQYKASLETAAPTEKASSIVASATIANSNNVQSNNQVSVGTITNNVNLENNQSSSAAAAMTTTTTTTSSSTKYDFGDLINELFDSELLHANSIEATDDITIASDNNNNITSSNNKSSSNTNDDKTRILYMSTERVSSPTRSLLLSETRYRLICFDDATPEAKDSEVSLSNSNNCTNYSTTSLSNKIVNDRTINDDDNNNVNNNKSIDDVVEHKNIDDSTFSSSPLLVTSQLLHHSAAHSARRKMKQDNASNTRKYVGESTSKNEGDCTTNGSNKPNDNNRNMFESASNTTAHITREVESE